MRVIIQRVKGVVLSVNKEQSKESESELEVFSKIKEGLICFIGIHKNDTWNDALYIIRKCLGLRLWSNDNKTWDKSVKDMDYELLLVSQFTLFANTKKGNRPDFHLAKDPNNALIMFNKIVNEFIKEYKKDKIKTGKFGCYMHIEAINDGPISIIVDSHDVNLDRS
ncbi:D-tyrosyl-tRNA(Tyr) deacylase, putative [Plasmodium berghei]|uniref:D-aminoacyl-tRNA deacylase n=2 Tax=Plasmodium berghei TaxID=5821 RepID=A0A509AK98_PLABA|nr:D-tyrosyl-tRNA(Tyr) deacylase, putative [Plasmodium berghei ANKA]CXI46022.1 D-tyrosyl-tRNA(Tyr) deacylase, putative [Plasmodium berghei]SCM22740.1 D-tyrosyl-tRNA(Tyr) deacylase, putative [Plasmodium berghei]SCN25645.1 D-tyrosyl-tRNA(Tyr) deacylase, putative [Plasmodium berghei]SCO60579.1 D-tyrosyl-tRNA(Tyr) deacylase, putative [Plasmodium berghei]SCO62322.1 D-tyrosyl-tRNA(Tyr) deacylase, putative [Plasmodium berghei]|eukprot:XP_034421739.1 D-tyrosyl-tRNA(Tyr) deacylase, putative [Plasmodium berghei ANKA]